MNARRLGPAIGLVLLFNPSLPARRPHKTDNVTAVKMHDDPKHSMIAVSCRINGTAREYACVIDSGATHTIISDRVIEAEGPLMDVTTANGVIRLHQREVSLALGEGLELKAKAFVQTNMTPQDVDILVGQDVLRQFRAVIFDYEKGQVEFQR